MGEMRVSVVLFDGFELLDVFGPLEVCGVAEGFEAVLVGPTAGPVAASQGARVLCDYSYEAAPPPDIVMVPGGAGTRQLAYDKEFLSWLAQWAGGANLVTSVCSGAALLAAAGLLEGHRATSNKRAFEWVRQFGAEVEWDEPARYVHDRTRWTSGGISAGIDMSLALVAGLSGQAEAERVAKRMEYSPDPAAQRSPRLAASDML
jgi:transcriptional regulator GlxA family with amidase domain